MITSLPCDYLLDTDDIISDIEYYCSAYQLSDANATYEFKKLRALKLFAYKVRFEAAVRKNGRALLTEVREDLLALDVDDDKFASLIEDAQAMGYLRVMTDVSKQETWVFA